MNRFRSAHWLLLAVALVALRSVLVAWVLSGNVVSNEQLNSMSRPWLDEFNVLWWVAGGCAAVGMFALLAPLTMSARQKDLTAPITAMRVFLWCAAAAVLICALVALLNVFELRRVAHARRDFEELRVKAIAEAKWDEAARLAAGPVTREWLKANGIEPTEHEDRMEQDSAPENWDATDPE